MFSRSALARKDLFQHSSKGSFGFTLGSKQVPVLDGTREIAA
jgi:hypothetical protein